MSTHGIANGAGGGDISETTPLLSSTSGKPETNSSNDANNNNTNAPQSIERLDSAPPPSRDWQRVMGLRSLSSGRWFPAAWDVRDVVLVEELSSIKAARYGRPPSTTRIREYRSWTRRLFLVLTEPDTSLLSAAFFVVVVVAIMTMNILMMLQTMQMLQFTPTDCQYCGGDTAYMYDDDALPNWKDLGPDLPDGVACLCPPAPYAWTDQVLKYLIYFFSVEWILRVLCFAPAPHERANGFAAQFGQWVHYLFSWPLQLDFWATFPYYMEFLGNSNGLMSLRLLRLFRVFQLVRLGSYNATFTTLLSVLQQSVLHLKLLCMILIFGAALFGSLIFWLEKGTWKYWEATEKFEFVRANEHGEEEVSPFTSIPATFYWFMVTATTVGYGDVYPTSHVGRWVGVLAMLTGVLVIAFPVGVFSDLWSKELEKRGALGSLESTVGATTGGGGGGDDGDDTIATGADTTITDRDSDPVVSVRDYNSKFRSAQQSPQGSRDRGMRDLDTINMGSIPAASIGVEQAPMSGNSAAASAAAMEKEWMLDEFLDGAGAAGDGSQSIPTVSLNPYSAHRVHPVTGSAARNWNYGYQHAPHIAAASTVSPSEIVIMQKSDLAEILVQMQHISQSQRAIRHVLHKYKIARTAAGGGSGRGGGAPMTGSNSVGGGNNIVDGATAPDFNLA